MLRGFVDMQSNDPHSADTLAGRLQTGLAVRPESVSAMRPGWRGLGELCDVPTSQFEWSMAAMNLIKPGMEAMVAYASDASRLRAVLPLQVRRYLGVDHLHFLSPRIPLPPEIAHTDRAALQAILKFVMRQRKPLILEGMLAESKAVAALREMVGEKRIEPAESASCINLITFPLPERAQSAARVSILATSYGLSGGPNDVLFQYVSPSLDQVRSFYDEALQMEGPCRQVSAPDEIDSFEFLRSYSFLCTERGDIRFSCLRLGSRLLAVQMFQLRNQTAWLLKAGHIARFRGTTLDVLLMAETIRRLRQEGAERIVFPTPEGLKELGNIVPLPRVTIRIYPWTPRSLLALSLGKTGRRVARTLRRKKPPQGT